MGTLTDHVRREMKKGLVMKAITCPVTGQILDVRTAKFFVDSDGDPAAVVSPAGMVTMRQEHPDRIAALAERGFHSRGGVMSAPSSDKAAIRQVIRALKSAGLHTFRARDGENEDVTTSNENELIDHITSCDEGVLFVQFPAGRYGHVYFVLGNDPEEVVCDYTLNLEYVIGPLTKGWWE